MEALPDRRGGQPGSAGGTRKDQAAAFVSQKILSISAM
jgi:hypothetical protein